MRLEDTGFYTLSDQRALTATSATPLQRCELIITDKCNFKCPYCRGLRSDIKSSLSLDNIYKTLFRWSVDGVRNIRLSGGEPTVHPQLTEIVEACRLLNPQLEHLAISTNGSADIELYKYLHRLGVNDFSISLDACCSAIGDKMTGVSGAWKRVISNIRELAKLTYVTVGMVFTEENVSQCIESVMFANSLGVADIRVIPSAQYNQALTELSKLPETMLDEHPILKYRINNVRNGRAVRGIDSNHNTNVCGLVLDDIAVAGDMHFPCIIYMREGGNPIGKVSKNMRYERQEWFRSHNSGNDPICSKNCLDVCIDYNNRFLDRTYQEDWLNPIAIPYVY